MEQIGQIDHIAFVWLVMAILVVGCVAIFVALREKRAPPDQLVTESVHCPQRRETAMVTFIERMRRGLATRRVESCSLLDVGERCSEACTHRSTAEPPRQPA